MADWAGWHRDYDNPSSSLARRLRVVRQRLTELLTDPHRSVRTVLDLCAGDGRDLLPVLAALEPARRPATTMVELDPDLATTARSTAKAHGLAGAVTVVTGDAGRTAGFAARLPVDLLVLCGIFGNVSDADVQRTIAAAGPMLTPGGVVVWTRGGSRPDRRPTLRRWFAGAGFAELGWDSEPEGYGVGVHERGRVGATGPLPPTLFRFRT